MMFAVTALELWVAIPAFRSGALATGRFELKTFVRAWRAGGVANHTLPALPSQLSPAP